MKCIKCGKPATEKLSNGNYCEDCGWEEVLKKEGK